MNDITFGSLFAGIGGFDLGFERAGMRCVWQVEIDDYANRVLAKHWPDVRRCRDIREFPPEPVDDWRCDVICGGFPCQDISFAGKGAGLAGERSGLFYELIRVVRVVRPRVVVLENVAALLVRGMGDVLGTLASLGFDADWDCVPAAAVGAPHIRDRVFLASDSRHWGVGIGTWEARSKLECKAPERSKPRGDGEVRLVAGCLDWDSDCIDEGEERWAREGKDVNTCGGGSISVPHRYRRDQRGKGLADAEGNEGRQCDGNGAENGNHWATEPAVGRVADGIPNRVDRLRGLGNAVVPQVAEFIGRRVVEMMQGMESKVD